MKDRLAGWIYWKSRATLDQAALVAIRQKGAIDFDQVREWSLHEKGGQQAFDDLMSAIESLKRSG